MAAHEGTRAIGTWHGSDARKPAARVRTLVRPLDSPWLSPKEAAAYLGVGVDAIYEACSLKGLRHSKLGHSTIRLRRQWIDAWVESRARETR